MTLRSIMRGTRHDYIHCLIPFHEGQRQEKRIWKLQYVDPWGRQERDVGCVHGGPSSELAGRGLVGSIPHHDPIGPLVQPYK